MINQGDVYWVDLGEPMGSEAGFRRPVVVVQADAFNRSRMRTTLVVPLTTNVGAAQYPGNVPLPPKATGLNQLSVASVAQVRSIATERLGPAIGHVPAAQLGAILRGLALVLGIAI